MLLLLFVKLLNHNEIYYINYFINDINDGISFEAILIT